MILVVKPIIWLRFEQRRYYRSAESILVPGKADVMKYHHHNYSNRGSSSTRSLHWPVIGNGLHPRDVVRIQLLDFIGPRIVLDKSLNIE